MKVTQLKSPVVRFLSDAVESDQYGQMIAAFTKDQYGDPASDRRPGVHLSSIIHNMYARLEGKPLEERLSDRETTGKNMRMSTGMAWEYVLSWALHSVFPLSRIITPEPMIMDGVHLTPDRFDTGTSRVIEIKATWTSCNKAATPADFIEHFWWWRYQLSAYCRALEVNEGEFIVWFLNGDYHPPGPIPPRVFLVEFTDEDLDNDWRTIRRHGIQMGLLKQ